MKSECSPIEARFRELVSSASPCDGGAFSRARERWMSIAKPLGGLGVLEDDVCRVASALGTENPSISRRALAVFCSDNGVVSEGVTQAGQEVTRIVYENMIRGESSVCKMAKTARVSVFPLDVGIAPNGTRNFIERDAMTRGECFSAIVRGVEEAGRLASLGFDILCTGEMGIGNTTTSAAVASVLLGLPPSETVGRGAGLSDEGLSRKRAVVARGISLRAPDASDAADVLSKLGGFDIAAMCGVFIGGAVFRRPVVVDGFISAVAALCASNLVPESAGYMIASHVSSEGAGRAVLSALGLRAAVDAGFHLGEGTGCMAFLPMLDMALDVYKTMPTFGQIRIEAYKPF